MSYYSIYSQMSQLTGVCQRVQVIEYLSKKGYNRTEAMLRSESANQDAEGRPIIPRAEDAGGAKYGKGLGKLSPLPHLISH